ncbi:RteC domain-containing protein [Maribacter sp. 2308TA10-17]|uniref:RteC domain-containing protein n=1 Tax=Maribacter sp. 2308TA10-17 TaxID=3386276 RepID=UPI0039BD2E23
MLYDGLLSKFYKELKELQQNTSTFLEEANTGNILCARTINKMKKVVQSQGFENKDTEIQFFKSIKIIPMQYLIYYTEVRSCELRFPKIGKTNQFQFLEKQVDKVNSFFEKHTEFLIYVDEAHEHLDKHYFTRKYLHRAPIIESYPYYKDPTFNTSHDGILARIRAMAMLTNYLKEKKREIEGIEMSNELTKRLSSVKWTGSYAAFVEMVYGCDAMSYFNNGNIEIQTIIEELGDFLNVPKGNSSRTYNELKNRKHSRVKFFEEASQKLLDKMIKEDGLGNYS